MVPKRYEHWILPARPAAWPDSVLCLTTAVDWTTDPANTRRQNATLNQWRVVLCVRDGNEYRIARHAVGRNAETFWESLTTASIRSKNPWVLCDNTRQCAAVLNLWEGMESGYVTLCGSDWRTADTGRNAMSAVPGKLRSHLEKSPTGLASSVLRAMPNGVYASVGHSTRRDASPRNRNGGICILQDPPIILELRISGGGCRITWVDAANYGWDTGTEETKDKSNAGRLASWFLSAASTLQSLGSSGWKHTAGSQAMHLYRSVYHETPILSNTEPSAITLEHDGLFGGRCECFAVGRMPGRCYLYDIRSLYPYLCAVRNVPVSLDRIVVRPTTADCAAICMDKCGIARVDIDTQEPRYPRRIGPDDDIRIKGNQRVKGRTIYGNKSAVIYPVGRFTTTLAGEELAYGLSTGDVRNVRLVAVYKSKPALKGYAEALYRRRCIADSRGERELSQYIKRLMVSLPGKFAQRYRLWESVPGADAPWEWGEWYSETASGETQRWRSIAGNVQREITGGFSNGGVPSITACICASGRMRLLQCIASAGMENVYYCDTDAIITSEAGSNNLTAAGWIRQGEWGYLQTVVADAVCDIFGIKHYRIGERVRFAGVPSAAMGDRGSAAGGIVQPWIGSSMLRHERPASWRMIEQPTYGPGRYNQSREPGGRVRPIELEGWDKA